MQELVRELRLEIGNFNEKIERARKKVDDRIKKMDDEINEVNEALKVETRNLLNAELEDDKKAADKHENLITELQGKLARKVEKKVLVENTMKEIKLHDPKDIEKIKTISVKAQQKFQ